MAQAEDVLAMAERHVRQFEATVARQAVLAAELEAGGHSVEAERAKAVLVTFVTSLDLAREHLRIERQARGLEP